MSSNRVCVSLESWKMVADGGSFGKVTTADYGRYFTVQSLRFPRVSPLDGGNTFEY